MTTQTNEKDKTDRYGHQLLPKPLHDEWLTKCDDGAKRTAECGVLEQKMSNLVGNLDPYNLDYPVCTTEKFVRVG